MEPDSLIESYHLPTESTSGSVTPNSSQDISNYVPDLPDYRPNSPHSSPNGAVLSTSIVNDSISGSISDSSPINVSNPSTQPNEINSESINHSAARSSHDSIISTHDSTSGSILTGNESADISSKQFELDSTADVEKMSISGSGSSSNPECTKSLIEQPNLSGTTQPEVDNPPAINQIQISTNLSRNQTQTTFDSVNYMTS